MMNRRYNIINNSLGWLCFLIAGVSYLLTIEPTASFWDCPEFISQGFKLEVGHPPGNPIFMLAARFAINLIGGDVTKVAMAVNSMNALLSAGTIMLLFWTITHLMRRLIVKDGSESISTAKIITIFGSGLVGALAYAWSDTFWYSAVEGEVYSFSSFCTALVFWLILKWENRADMPHSDRYLVLIAYIIGVSIAVHLLNLLCIPAIVLVFYYKKWAAPTAKGSLMALLLSFVIVALILFGLVPGFIEVAQYFELFFVNTLGLGFNTGVIVYTILAVVSFIWSLRELYAQKSATRISVSFIAAIFFSGVPFIGHSLWIPVFVLAGLGVYLATTRKLPVRILTLVTLSVMVIFAGYSSYALLLIRSSAKTPMNQNAPDNVFDLGSYLNREQYGETPLLYGTTFGSDVLRTPDGSPAGTEEYNYAKQVKQNPGDPDRYVKVLSRTRYDYIPQLNMVFPRLYSRDHRAEYMKWAGITESDLPTVACSSTVGYDGKVGPATKRMKRPTFGQNLNYFINYQLVHMYFRYFMWNFAGRQNDINNQQGELDAGNWISGIPFIDNPRLGDQSLLPDDLGKGNQGHNVYFMLPLILGILGLIWQSFAGKRGIEQFWVVFFLFFMTGIAIVLYLNQPPNQPRERDYAFAGSFYAYAIWIGMGVAALWRMILYVMDSDRKKRQAGVAKLTDEEEIQPENVVNEPASLASKSRIAAMAAAVIGMIVPLQMVSQTWDDHDRSHRFAARDYAINYLESLEPNAIVFCNGDNDTFPLWYAQEVEGVRPDVRIINLSYLNSDWYANQMRQQAYDSAPVDFTATPKDYAYGRSDVTILGRENAPADLLSSLKIVYEGGGRAETGYPTMPSGIISIPVDKEAVVKRGLVAPSDTANIVDNIVVNLRNTETYRAKGYLSLGEILMLDIVATNAANGWKRPIYWVTTVGSDYHVGLSPYMRSTGMAHQLVPTIQEGLPARTDRAYDVVTKKYRWGGADAKDGKVPYFDETARRMLLTTRSSMLDVASELIYQGDTNPDSVAKREDYKKALEVADLMANNLPEVTAPYGLSIASTLGQVYCELGEKKRLDDKKLTDRGLDVLWKLMERYAPYLAYNREMAMSFGNPSLTVESRLVPYQFYHFASMYEQFGGDSKKVDELVKHYGLTMEDLEKNYNRLYGTGSQDYTSTEVSGQQPNSATLDSYAEEIAKYCEISNELAGLSPEEYAKRSDDERAIDSMLYTALKYFHSVGGTDEMLKKYDNFNRLDMARTKRLSEEFAKRHPEMGL